ncbi:MAG: ATP-binding protein [Candidatus Saganbacteria bacterium]|nr:ATP-binding protein [Candidatus Saganbacteria bacterium]
MIANITLGLLVYLKNVKNPANRLFMFLTFAVFLWAFSVLSYSEAHTLEMAFLWSKVSAFFALLIGILSFYFSFYFPKKFKELNASIKAFLWSLLFVISGLIAFNLVVSDVRGDFSAFSMIIGPFFCLYCFSFVFYMSGGLWILYDKYRKYTGLLKMQIRYVFLGFFLGTAPPLFTNLIFPLFGNSSFADYGPFFTVITLIFIAYSIVRHRLMGIEFVVQRGITYSLLSVFAMFIYGAMLFLVGELMRGQEGGNLFFVIGLSSVILAITFQPILRWLEKATDKFFFKGHYDYQRTIQEVSQAITSVIKLEEIVRLVVRTLTELMRVKEISFLVLERERGKFKSIGLELEGKGSHYKIMEIDEKSPIVSWIKTKKDVLVDDEIESNIAVENEEGIKRSLKDVYEEIERLELVIWVPIISRGEIVGLIVLGEKLSGDIFTSEDVRLLKTLGNQIAVGIENTALYEEVLAVKNYAEDILMSMSNGILTTDLSGGIVTFNYMAEKLTGLSSKNVIGKSIKDVFGADSIVVAAVESTLKDRCYSNFETVLDLAGGGKSMVSISSTLLRDNYGKRMGGLISLTDVSEVKELQGKVQQADKLAALGTMAAGMAHEIKNPLSSMKVLTQLLPLKFEDLEYRQKFSEIMPREIERIDRIVESLLGFARAASPKFEKIRIEAVMSDTLEYYKRKMEENSVKLDLHQEDVPPIIGDFGQLSQVFSNLVLNAIQVMQGGGVLKVVIRRGKRTSEGIDTVAVEVSDTGKGMDKETLSKLFDPFYTTKYGGTGLGLTISHSIVSGHRGFIDVKSEVGKGTAFTVILPVTQ